jgi:hypothetical protein
MVMWPLSGVSWGGGGHEATRSQIEAAMHAMHPMRERGDKTMICLVMMFLETNMGQMGARERLAPASYLSSLSSLIAEVPQTPAPACARCRQVPQYG